MSSTFITYAGSKQNIIEKFLPMFNKSDKKIFVDLFCGGGSVSSFVAEKCNFDKIIMNDINKELIILMQDCKAAYERDGEQWAEWFFQKAYDKCPKTKEDYYNFRNEYNVKEFSNPWEKAFEFLVIVSCCLNNIVRYNKSNKINCTYGDRTFNKNSIKRMCDFLESIKNKNISFSSLSYEELMPENSLIYIDPPYSNSGVGYCSWTKSDDEKLALYIVKLIENDNDVVISSFIKNGVDSPLNQALRNILTEYSFDIEYKAAKKDNSYKEVVFTNIQLENNL